jgi:uncharacterized protein YgiM (DUF1202 family)
MKTLILYLLLLGSFYSLTAQESAGSVTVEGTEVVTEAAPVPVPVSEPVEVTVLGDRVNLRNAPSLESEVIGQANYGDVYTAVATTDLWIEILPPESVAVWAYGPLLFEDQEVRAPEMNVRSGPGVEFARLGELLRGTPVTVLESLGEWRRIETPESVTLWISRDFVQLPPSIEKPARPEPEPTATPVPVPTPVTIVEVRTVEKIVEVPVAAEPTPEPEIQAPADLDLVPLRGQGTASSRRGEIKSFLLKAGSPSRFMLRRANSTPLCYLLGDEDQLRALAGSTVLVRGRDFWVTGEELPVMEVRSLEIMEGAGE